MVNATQLSMLEVVTLENGKFTVRSFGDLSVADDGEEFDTEAEAQARRLELAEELESRESGLDVLKPGGGQGLR